MIGTTTVLYRGSETDLFSIHTCSLAGMCSYPNRFLHFLALVLILVHDHLPSGVVIEYRMDGQLFNLRRFHSKSKVTQASITDLQHANDSVILSHSEDPLQTILNLFSSTYQSL